MRLVDRHPRRVGEHGEGVSFDCPCGSDHRATVMFDRPLDGGEPAPDLPLWTRTGDTFDTMTLEPSVRVRSGDGEECWHGHLTNGELVR